METNSLGNFQEASSYHRWNTENQHELGQVLWTHPGLKITRLRLLTDPGFPFWDVSYCHDLLDGKHVRVLLPFSQLRRKNISAQIIEYAKRDKVYAKGVGILDCISTLC